MVNGSQTSTFGPKSGNTPSLPSSRVLEALAIRFPQRNQPRFPIQQNQPRFPIQQNQQEGEHQLPKPNLLAAPNPTTRSLLGAIAQGYRSDLQASNAPNRPDKPSVEVPNYASSESGRPNGSSGNVISRIQTTNPNLNPNPNQELFGGVQIPQTPFNGDPLQRITGQNRNGTNPKEVGPGENLRGTTGGRISDTIPSAVNEAAKENFFERLKQEYGSPTLTEIAKNGEGINESPKPTNGLNTDPNTTYTQEETLKGGYAQEGDIANNVQEGLNDTGGGNPDASKQRPRPRRLGIKISQPSGWGDTRNGGIRTSGSFSPSTPTGVSQGRVSGITGTRQQGQPQIYSESYGDNPSEQDYVPYQTRTEEEDPNRQKSDQPRLQDETQDEKPKQPEQLEQPQTPEPPKEKPQTPKPPQTSQPQMLGQKSGNDLENDPKREASKFTKNVEERAKDYIKRKVMEYLMERLFPYLLGLLESQAPLIAVIILTIIVGVLIILLIYVAASIASSLNSIQNAVSYGNTAVFFSKFNPRATSDIYTTETILFGNGGGNNTFSFDPAGNIEKMGFSFVIELKNREDYNKEFLGPGSQYTIVVTDLELQYTLNLPVNEYRDNAGKVYDTSPITGYNAEYITPKLQGEPQLISYSSNHVFKWIPVICRQLKGMIDFADSNYYKDECLSGYTERLGVVLKFKNPIPPLAINNRLEIVFGGTITIEYYNKGTTDKLGSMQLPLNPVSICVDVTNIATVNCLDPNNAGDVNANLANNENLTTLNPGTETGDVVPGCPININQSKGEKLVCTSGYNPNRVLRVNGNNTSSAHYANDLVVKNTSGQSLKDIDVISPVDGTIIKISTDSSYIAQAGIWVQIQDKNNPNVIVMLAHLQPGFRKFNVGETVKKGDILGKFFNGAVPNKYWTGPHLHFEVIYAPNKNGSDPQEYLKLGCNQPDYTCSK